MEKIYQINITVKNREDITYGWIKKTLEKSGVTVDLVDVYEFETEKGGNE